MVALVFLALTTWSWRKWAELLVDFGQQLYVPWQLASGKRLYEDIAFLHGPLSQHFNALWFRIFGASVTVLILINLCILAGVTTIIYRIVRLSGDRLTATIACLILLCVFGFSQYVGIANYNYVCPYTHEATHGIALIAAMILLLSRYLTRGGRGAGAGASLCLGLALLTKVDVAVAAVIVAAAACGIGVLMTSGDTTPHVNAVDLPLFAGIAVAPALGFFLFFLSYLPAGEALRALGGGISVFESEVATNPFYLRVLGFDHVAENTWQMLRMFWLAVVFVVCAAAADLASVRLSRHPLPLGLILGTVLFIGLLLQPDLFPWRELPRALPLTTLLAFVVFVALFLKYHDQTEPRSATIPMLLWTTSALVLLAKIVLNVHVFHYGFYLAMPATVGLAVGLVYWIPQGLRATFGGGIVFRSIAVGVLAAGLVYHLRWSQETYRVKNFPIGQGGDTIFTYNPVFFPQAVITAAALRWIDNEMPAGATFAALPDGIMLNYLSRRTTTLPQMSFMMAEMIVWGEPALLTGFKNRPPDYVVLVDKDMSEFGMAPFGTDQRYGKLVMDWVNQHYEPVARMGSEPFQGDGFGIKILKRTR